MFTQIAMETAQLLYDKLKHVEKTGPACRFTRERCEQLAPLVDRINRQKAAQNAIILAHSYVSPEITYGVADFVGDSYELSKKAANTDASTIVFAAVRFMGETAKILSPQKTVLIPGTEDGCSLADAITAEDVRQLKQKYPGYAVACYINTTAEVKAECDVCVTSANATDILQRFPNDKMIFIPDRLMGTNLRNELAARGVNKELVLWDGCCYVHEEYDPATIVRLRAAHPGLAVLAHPECSPQVVGAADFVGSTSQLLAHIKKRPESGYYLLTECGLADRLKVEMPQVTFVGTCSLCKYMKSNTLESIAQVLEAPRPSQQVLLEESVRQKAADCIQAMFRFT